ncbi:hypothetical protein SVAN01_11480 [Stagonosporopsis vannaccii]|nr:hypothetical protein SVAN01_11480 [Stagonosporopsis vannaccii]
MSWNGPVAGAAPYQMPPYTNGQPAYSQQLPYQYGHQSAHGRYQHGPSYPGPPQRPQDSRPPKKKGNPIITRYPPPPGYRGLAQPQGPPFHGHQQSTQYQPPSQSGFPQVPLGQSAYPGHGYTAAPPQQGYPPHYNPPQAPTYPPSYSQGQTYQWPQQSYQTNHGSAQAPAYSATQSHGNSQSSYQSYPTHTAGADPNRQAYSQAPAWQQAPAQPTYPPQNQYNGYSGPAAGDQATTDPNGTQTPAIAHLGSAPPTLSNPPASVPHDNATDQKPELYLAWDDWDFDFDGAIWPKSNEPVDPNLSLGVIIWHPAKQVTRALPATFEEAEDQSLKPTPERLGNGESVSIYFTAENSHEAFLDVRQTDDWEYIKDDPAFVIFRDDDMQNNLVPIEDCIAQRDRSDEPVTWDERNEDAEMREADWSVMDNLEQALSASGEAPKPAAQMRATQPARGQTQEDILALLGVTGLPKPVSEEPLPFPMPTPDVRPIMLLPEKPDSNLHSVLVKPGLSYLNLLTGSSFVPRPQAGPIKRQSLSRALASDVHAVPQRSHAPGTSSNSGLPPPPPPPEQDRYDPWNPSNRHHQYHTSGFNGGRGSPARSEASNGTAAGSDFGTEKPTEASDISRTPGSKFERTDSTLSRKRSYGDTGTEDDRVRENDDHTKRKRRSLIDAAYG